MNKIDDILEQLKGQQPMIDDPDALTDRIMDSLPDISQPKSREVRMHWWITAAAACLLAVVGIATMLLFKAAPAQPELSQAQDGAVPTAGSNTTKAWSGDSQALVATLPSTGTQPPRQRYDQRKSPLKDQGGISNAKNRQEVPNQKSHIQVPEDPNLHYAAYELAKDTLPYQDPARVDEFIAKLAAYYDVKQGELTCSSHADSAMASAVYVFPDKQEINVFNRLLQVACWYSDEMPGYFLNFSHQQFFFELKDVRRQLQYRWIAERINGRILLYGTNAPIGTKESSACYQEYRDELMHINSINHKTKEI